MTGNQMFRHSHLTPYATYLVLEQPLQRFTKLQVHLLRQTAYVMMALDGLSRNIQALDTVGINRSLRQPLGIGYFPSFRIEHLHEVAADNLTLLLRIGHSLQILEELRTGIHANHVQPQTLVVVQHILELVLTQHPVVYEDTGQILTDSLVQQHSGHGGIHAAAQSENHPVVSQLRFQLGHRSVYERSRTPILLAAANVHYKVFQQQRSLYGMKHFRMELHAP